mgnify:CR=1 FL=1
MQQRILVQHVMLDIGCRVLLVLHMQLSMEFNAQLVLDRQLPHVLPAQLDITQLEELLLGVSQSSLLLMLQHIPQR